MTNRDPDYGLVLPDLTLPPRSPRYPHPLHQKIAPRSEERLHRHPDRHATAALPPGQGLSVRRMTRSPAAYLVEQAALLKDRLDHILIIRVSNDTSKAFQQYLQPG